MQPHIYHFCLRTQKHGRNGKSSFINLICAHSSTVCFVECMIFNDICRHSYRYYYIKQTGFISQFSPQTLFKNENDWKEERKKWKKQNKKKQQKKIHWVVRFSLSNFTWNVSLLCFLVKLCIHLFILYSFDCVNVNWCDSILYIRVYTLCTAKFGGTVIFIIYFDSSPSPLFHMLFASLNSIPSIHLRQFFPPNFGVTAIIFVFSMLFSFFPLVSLWISVHHLFYYFHSTLSLCIVCLLSLNCYSFDTVRCLYGRLLLLLILYACVCECWRGFSLE